MASIPLFCFFPLFKKGIRSVISVEHEHVLYNRDAFFSLDAVNGITIHPLNYPCAGGV